MITYHQYMTEAGLLFVVERELERKEGKRIKRNRREVEEGRKRKYMNTYRYIYI